MNILVPVKRVIDPYVAIRVKADQSGVETNNVKMAINPFDEIAVEQAVRWKEQGLAKQLTAVSIGEPRCQETLRHALALGIDAAIHIEHHEVLDPLAIAKILAALVKQAPVDMVLMGKQAIDDDASQVGPMLAALLDWPQATFASAVTLQGQEATVVREVDGGLETLRVQLPAVVTTDLRLNQPRYASLPNIMRAKSKPMRGMPLSELNVLLNHQGVNTLQVAAPTPRKPGELVSDVSTLLEKLRHEVKVL